MRLCPLRGCPADTICHHLRQVLVIPRRCVPTLAELTAAELTDLWESVRVVQQIVCREYGKTDAMLGVQDGRDAGQSVAHVHVHILPR
jgi:bis(5'-adenosyl)-triphosphatase